MKTVNRWMTLHEASVYRSPTLGAKLYPLCDEDHDALEHHVRAGGHPPDSYFYETAKSKLFHPRSFNTSPKPYTAQPGRQVYQLLVRKHDLNQKDPDWSLYPADFTRDARLRVGREQSGWSDENRQGQRKEYEAPLCGKGDLYAIRRWGEMSHSTMTIERLNLDTGSTLQYGKRTSPCLKETYSHVRWGRPQYGRPETTELSDLPIDSCSALSFRFDTVWTVYDLNLVIKGF